MAPLQRSLLGAGTPALARDAAIQRIQLDERSWVDVSRTYLEGADSLFEHLAETVEWTQGRRWMYERMVDDPRLSRWYRREGDPDPVLTEVRSDLQRRYRVLLSGVGLNYYRHGRDSVAPHRDRELRHLDDTLVAIVTLGAQRPFLVRPRGGGPSIDLSPGSGDLIVMGGACQLDWEHGVPKMARAGPRISASYRWTARQGRRERAPSFRASRRYGEGARSRP